MPMVLQTNDGQSIRPRRALWIVAVGFGLIFCGCRPGAEPPLPTFASVPEPYQPMPDSGNALDGYLFAGRQMMAHPDVQERKFTPQHESRIAKDASEAIAQVRRAGQSPMRWVMPSRGPEAEPVRAGWRLLGRAIAFRIKLRLADGDMRGAIDDLLTGTRFGMDLTLGPAMETDLGAIIADECRAAFTPAIARLDRSERRRVIAGLRETLTRSANRTEAFAREGENQRLWIAWLRDRQLKRDWEPVKAMFYPDGDNVARYLDARKPDPRKVNPFFTGLADEQLQLEAFWKRHGGADERVPELPKFEPKRVWRAPALHFLSTFVPMHQRYGIAAARLRILALTLGMQDRPDRGRGLTSTAPFSDDLARDPFSGRDLMITQTPSGARIYSVGVNGVDDGGETDEAGLSPDLSLESIPQAR
ncbi:MAG: hypothetical protein SFX74_06935 [Fimbriimonadaceae bacterium]|nr:hypothetical protein [Fimbriimonadaceae bacterium]